MKKILKDLNELQVILWVLVVAFVSHFVSPYIGYRAIGFIFLLLVIILGLFFPFGPIFVAATLSALIWNYFFIPPEGTLSIHAPEDVMMFLTYFVIASVSGFLTFQIKKNEKILREKEEKSRALYEILKSMTLVQGTETLIELAHSKIKELFHAENSIWLAENKEELNLSHKADFGVMVLNQKEKTVVLRSFETGRRTGWSTDNLPVADVLSLCLKTGDEKFGVLVFRPHLDQKLNPDQENLLFSITNQIAIALAKKKYDEEAKKNILLKESASLHQTLLNCISHELRTPLTAIMGAATALQGHGENPILLENIISASERLNHVFENLLDMTRLESKGIKLNREWFDVAELIRFTLDHQKKMLSQHKINFLSDESVYFLGDFTLLEHAFSNLLLNAIYYSPVGSVITVSIEKEAGEIKIHFKDEGEGVPPDLLPKIFEKFYRVPGTPTGGLGLGLSITKSLIELHQGRIEAKNNEDKGTAFAVILPYQDPPSQITGTNP